jgi:hypothetical protein
MHFSIILSELHKCNSVLEPFNSKLLLLRSAIIADWCFQSLSFVQYIASALDHDSQFHTIPITTGISDLQLQCVQDSWKVEKK